MDDERTTTLLGVGMVVFGTLQAAYAVTQNDTVLTGLGAVYAAVGGVLLWRERALN